MPPTPHSPLTTTLLKQYWGYDSFRPLQQEIIQSVLDGKDTLALMPTGGGKSLCYQVPAMAREGICLVISPLIALMKDQVENLRKKGITAFAIYTGMRRSEVINVLKTAGNSNCKFLYVSPERLETTLFKEYLPSLYINLIAVDEAHCISQWGYDFRPAYIRIAALRDELPGVPVLALTASATTIVQDDICEKLHFKNHQVFRQSFARPNLSYSVFRVDSKINKLADILSNVPGSSIVYCRSRKKTKEIAEQLCRYHIKADHYHAGLQPEERSRRQEEWIRNITRVIVCTNAFGMGIDKPDVRTVVHVDAPDCLESYYQEAGRAGRDGRRAYAVLLYQHGEPEALQEQNTLRFPAISTIRQVYQAVCNYLQLPSGSTDNRYYDFDLNDFMHRFNLPAHAVVNSLKTLEQEGYMGFNEQVFIPARMQFICGKDWLYQFEKEQPSLEPLIKLLLRSYEGIFDREVAIDEKLLAGWGKKEMTAVKKELLLLHRYNIIHYAPQKDTPQLYLLRERLKAEDITINSADYEKRIQQSVQRTTAFIDYIYHSTDCRSVLIGRYFGDNDVAPCGICDNCLEKKKQTNVTPEEFNNILHRIETSMGEAPIHTKELLQHIPDIQREKVWQVITFLQTENKITVTKEGMITRKS